MSETRLPLYQMVWARFPGVDEVEQRVVGPSLGWLAAAMACTVAVQFTPFTTW